jgi:hypothetical protein
MAAYTLVLCISAIGAVILPEAPELRRALGVSSSTALTLFGFTLIGVFFGTIVANVLANVRPKL